MGKFYNQSKPNDIYRPEIQARMAAKSILILTGDKTEDIEFFYPYYRFIEEGYQVDVTTPDGGAFKGKAGLGLQETKKLTEVDVDDYDLLYIPGGKAPAKLRKSVDVLALVRQFVASGKPVAAVCHGPQILAAADVIHGRRIAAWPEVEKEIQGAGAVYINQETVVDGPFITARWPGDLPSHLSQIMEVIHQGQPLTGGEAGLRSESRQFI